MTTQTIDAIKDKLGIVELIQKTGGATIHQNGNGWVGHHLAHGSESKTSLHIDPKTGLWHCKNCGQGGDQISWVGHQKYGAAYRNNGEMFVYALHEYARLAGVKLEEQQIDVEALAERRALEDIFSLVADYYHDQLPDDQREWLHSRYGLTDATIDELKIGFAPPDERALFATLRKQGIEAADLLKTGLFYRFNSGTITDHFQGRLIFPYWHRGHPVYFIGRQTDLSPQWEKDAAGMKYKKQMVHNDDHPYVSEQVRNDYFYAEDAALGADTLFVTEGVTDCIIANQAGFPCISPVTVQFKKSDHPKLLSLTKHAATVYIINDNENNEAGRKGAWATAAELWRNGKIAKFVELPKPDGVDKVDLNDFLRQHTPDDLRALLPTAKTLLDIYADAAIGADGDAKTDAMRGLFPLIALIDDPFLLAQWKDELTKKLGIKKGDYDIFLKAAVDTLADERRQAAQQDDADLPATWPYAVKQGRIVIHIKNKDEDTGKIEIHALPLCNFDARILADVLHDDGEEVALHMAIAGTLDTGEKLPEIDIKADEFEKMQWVVAQWGARAAIYARDQARGQLRHAIQVLSAEKLERRRVYTHTGWRVIDDKRVFLHAGGALGLEGVKVELPHNLRGYSLPTDDAIAPVTAMRESIALLDVAPSRVTYPLWAGIYLAPLASIIAPPFVISTEGESGSKKSSLNTVLLCHFGGTFSEHNTPADWMGTANSLEKLAFHAKDIPLLIDDLKPALNRHENQQMMTSVQRIYRAVGNRQGRSRLSGESDFRRTYEPRGVVMSTAERGVMGKSTNARGLTVYIENGDVDLTLLTQAQKQRQIYGYAMVGFLRTVAENWDMLEKALPAAVLDERLLNGDVGAHGRLPHAMATLYVAFDFAMKYAHELGAIDEAEYYRRCTECREVLRQIAADQSALVESQDPALIYVQTIITMLRQGKIKFVAKPVPAGALEGGYGTDPIGEYNGWHDDTQIYILPSAYNAVCKYVTNEGWSFPSDEVTLHRELLRGGYIGTAQDGRNTTGRRGPDGALKRVIAVNLEKFLATAGTMGIEADDIRYIVRMNSDDDSGAADIVDTPKGGYQN